MKVETGGSSYSFSFQHGCLRGLDYTRCQIYEIAGPEVSIIKSIGTVYRHVNDAPNRVLARKFALTKALAELGLGAAGRKAFWDVWLGVGRVKGYRRSED